MQSIFPEIIDHIPLKDYGLPGLIVHSDHTSTGTVYFVFAEQEVPFPEHSHAAQWTVVVSGKCVFTANGKSTTYSKGDTYFIPDGMLHQITLYPGYAEVDYVDDPKDGD